MDILSETLSLIQDTAVKAAVPRVLDVPGCRNRNAIVIGSGIVDFTHDVPKRSHVAHSLEAFTAYVSSTDSAIWHSGDKAIAVLDDTTESFRDDTVTWPIPPSAKWAAVRNEAGKPRQQKEFVTFIVANLRPEFDAAAPGLLTKLRSLKMTTVDEEQGNIQTGRESMGRQIERSVSGADDLPELLTVPVRRWASLDYVAAVECLLVVDLVTRTIALRPLADSLEQAEHSAQAWLHGLISNEAECPVYHGTP